MAATQWRLHGALIVRYESSLVHAARDAVRVGSNASGSVNASVQDLKKLDVAQIRNNRGHVDSVRQLSVGVTFIFDDISRHQIWVKQLGWRKGD